MGVGGEFTVFLKKKIYENLGRGVLPSMVGV